MTSRAHVTWPNNRTATEPVCCCDRSELRPDLPKLRLVEPEVPEHPNKYSNTHLCTTHCRGIPERMRGFWVGALSPWCHCPHKSGGNLTATRRCGTTTPANPSDGRSGYRAPPAPRKPPGNQHGKTTEERREGGSKKQERQARRPSRGSWNVTPAACEKRQGKVGLRGTLACWHSGLRAVAQVRVCSSQTRRARTSLGLVWPSGL